jgi:hypothetical protein
MKTMSKYEDIRVRKNELRGQGEWNFVHDKLIKFVDCYKSSKIIF